MSDTFVGILRGASQMNQTKNKSFRLGPMIVRDLNQTVSVHKEHSPKQNRNFAARHHLFEVIGPKSSKLQLAYAVLESTTTIGSKERLIRGTSASGSKVLQILGEGRRRLQIEGHPSNQTLEMATLQQIWIDPDDPDKWPRWRRTPTLGELNAGAELDVAKELEAIGGQVAAKRALYGNDYRYRNQYFVTFDRGNQIIPIAVYLLTRFLPAAYQYVRVRT